MVVPAKEEENTAIHVLPKEESSTLLVTVTSLGYQLHAIYSPTTSATCDFLFRTFSSIQTRDYAFFFRTTPGALHGRPPTDARHL